ncbi:MAG: hypothetical protein CMI58_06210 [Parcubacteria group bacterium]|nr:hypothetical protein [Parcubacteria group bacterium]
MVWLLIGRLPISSIHSVVVTQVCRKLGITEQTYYRWRKESGGMKVGQEKGLKESSAPTKSSSYFCSR